MIVFWQGNLLSIAFEFLIIAIMTDFFDGPMARNNNEVTSLGTYMDHIADWSVILWVIFLFYALRDIINFD